MTKLPDNFSQQNMSVSLETQRAQFTGRRFLAMPLAGLIAWTITGIGAHFLSPYLNAMLLFAATGSIFFLGLLISRLTGEDFFPKNKNPFDQLLFSGMAQALLVYSIAIPFFIIDKNSLPLSVGILTGLMWLPLSWVIQHWIGVFHAVVRTLMVLITWYMFPESGFVAIPVVIVGIYLVTIAVMEQRWQKLLLNKKITL